MWEDCTTYSKRDTERIPSAWELRTGWLRISVVNDHIHYPGAWIMHCPEVGIRERFLGDKDKLSIVHAQQKAEQVVKQKLEKMINSLK